jgi:S-adenosylmethionine synthetase
MILRRIARTAEHVSEGHPDKFCDQVADRILDEVLRLCGDNQDFRKQVRTAVECVAKDNLLVVSGEVRVPDTVKLQLDVVDLAQEVWKTVGYGSDSTTLTVINHIRPQSINISEGVDPGGAGDQGIMVGYATDETAEMMPAEWVMARDLCLKLRDLRVNGTLAWLRSDCKSQVTVDPEGRPTAAVIAAQHDDSTKPERIREEILSHVVMPVLGDINVDNVKINGCGKFIIGGPAGDAGVVGRKIVVDAYGPRVPVGGGCYSGKDPTKVDRSAAYMARKIARAVVKAKVDGAKECLVTLAYCIGQTRPEMVTAITDADKDVSGWVSEKFPDLSPRKIISDLRMQNPEGWSYVKTAAYGHYGRSMFPWEK